MGVPLKKRIKRLRRKLRYNVMYFLIKCMIFLSGLMSRQIWLRIFGAMGRLSYYLAPRSRRLTRKHLAYAYGSEKSADEIKKISKDVFKMIGMNAGDLIRGYKISEYDEFKK